MKAEDIIVLELSSFQLMTMEVSPNIAVITNISPNHLDVHKNYEEYINSKQKIFEFQNEDDKLILNYDDKIVKSFENKANSKVSFFSSNEILNDGVILDNGKIKLCENGLRRHILSSKNIKLIGKHNLINICAAIAATKDLVDIENLIKAIIDFNGVEHRLEFVKEAKGVKWYNDSIASTPTRTIAALNSFNENITLIVGGYDKNLDYDPLAIPILQKVNNLILMGQTADKIYNSVENKSRFLNKKINIQKVNSLEEAVKAANKVSINGDIVLLSPASASFDMFKNFEERGNNFKRIVNKN